MALSPAFSVAVGSSSPEVYLSQRSLEAVRRGESNPVFGGATGSGTVASPRPVSAPTSTIVLASAFAVGGSRLLRRLHRRKFIRVAFVRERIRLHAGGGEPVQLALAQRLNELAKVQDNGSGPRRWETIGDCEVCVPEGQFPWGVVFFLGGALIGQYPRLCYDALLRPLADRTGCCVIAVPYEVDTDHGLLALDVQRRFGVALSLAEDRYGWNVGTMPKFALGHSLGAKLHVIRHCKEQDQAAVGKEPLAVMAFNNFGITDSISLAREALRMFQGVGTPPGMDQIFSVLEPMAKKYAESAGLEFNPGPEEMEDMMREGFQAPSTKVLVFGDDQLDCGEDLISATAERGNPVQRSALEGNHLTPVFLKAADLAGAGIGGQMGSRAAAAAAERGLEVGDEQQMEALIQELEGWLRPR